MAHGLASYHHHGYKDISKWFDRGKAMEDEQFYRDGFRALPETWEKLLLGMSQILSDLFDTILLIKWRFHEMQRELGCASDIWTLSV